MHQAVADHVARGSVPGAVWYVGWGAGSEIRAVGTTAFEGGRPMRRDTIFRISSLTKPVTAAATMILVDDGVLQLDDAVDRWLPELANPRVLKSLEQPIDATVPALRPITVRDLLTFTFGFGMVMAMPGTYRIQRALDELTLGESLPSPSVAPPPDEWMRRFATLPLIHQPGQAWMYNTGSNILGVLIARASGAPLADFMRERLFDPLGMVDTGFAVPPDKVDRFTTSYITDRRSGAPVVYDLAEGGQWNRPPAFASGAGGLVSTVDDYILFAQMMMHGGVEVVHDRRILSESSVTAMTRDQLTPEQKSGLELQPGYWDNHGWGLGLSVVTGAGDPAGPPGTFGWDGGMGTVWRANPSSGITSMLWTQVAFPSPAPPPIFVDFWTTVQEAVTD